LERAPNRPEYLNTLGVVQYRLGLHIEAVLTLQESLRRGGGRSDAFDLFFLSRAHARLGHRAESRDCFDRAARWLESRADLQADDELSAFRIEAEAVLQDADFPRDPFGAVTESVASSRKFKSQSRPCLSTC